MKYGTCERKITLKRPDNHLTGESLNQQSAAAFSGSGPERTGQGGEEGEWGGGKGKHQANLEAEEEEVVKKKKKTALGWLTYSE